MSELSANAERALLFQYVLNQGRLPAWSNGDEIKIFMRISALGEAEAVAAYAELEDAGMIDRNTAGADGEVG
jgi:hypothetical protein